MMTYRIRMMFSHASVAALLVLAACGDGGTGNQPAASSTTAAPTTTTSTPTTTTAEPSTTTTTEPPTTTTVEPTALERLGYPVSSEWTVEAVVSDIDSSTGGLAIDAEGNFYQADFGSAGAIYKISPSGEIETLVAEDNMENLTMTVFGPDGDIYQSSYGSGEVYKISPDGSEVEVVVSDIRGPTGLLVNDDGSFYVQAYDAGLLHLVDASGNVSTFVNRSGLLGPNGMDRGPDGTIYATNHRDGGLFAIDPDGEITELHMFPKESSHLAYFEGSLFVTSRGSFVVYRYDLETGDIEVIAGSGEASGEGSIGRPNAITVGPDGALYINAGDGNSNSPVTIWRISKSS